MHGRFLFIARPHAKPCSAPYWYIVRLSVCLSVSPSVTLLCHVADKPRDAHTSCHSHNVVCNDLLRARESDTITTWRQTR